MLIIILLGIGAMLLFLGLASLRAHRLQERYALLFLFLALPFVVLAAWPDAIGLLAAAMGIEYPTVLLLCVTTFFLLMTFKLLSIVSVQERRIAALAQVVALLAEGRDLTSPPAASGDTPRPSSPRAARGSSG